MNSIKNRSAMRFLVGVSVSGHVYELRLRKLA